MPKVVQPNPFVRNNSTFLKNIGGRFLNALSGLRNAQLDYKNIAAYLNSGKKISPNMKINAKQALHDANANVGSKLDTATQAYQKLLTGLKEIRRPDGTPLSRGQFRKLTNVANDMFSKALFGDKVIDMKKMDSMMNKFLALSETVTAATSGTAIGIEALQQEGMTERYKQSQQNKNKNNDRGSSSSSNSSELDNPGSNPWNIG